jgi:hypothetical protein
MIARLADLRPLLEGYSSSLELFDELMREEEWDSALHIVTGKLLESKGPPITPVVIQRVVKLHESMSLEDNCLARLNAKLAQRDGS